MKVEVSVQRVWVLASPRDIRWRRLLRPSARVRKRSKYCHTPASPSPFRPGHTGRRRRRRRKRRRRRWGGG